MKRIFYAFIITAVIMASAGCSHKCDKLNIIFETDIGNDIDDALALDMLYKYHKYGKINFQAVMLNKCAPAPAEYMDIMNTWYGHPDMPVGIVRNGTDDKRGKYSQKVVDMTDEDGTPMFKRSKGNYDKYPDAHILYRKILAGLPDKSVVIPSVGFSTNLARLLDTPADEYSPLTGKELVARKVKILVAMAGHGTDSCFREYNVMRDVPSAKKVLEQWPTPIVISPFELGYAIKYPGSSIENDFDWAPRHPMVKSYKVYEKMPYDRPTWDLTAVLYAVEGGAMFTESERCDIRVTEKGATVFTPDKNGNVTYLKADAAQAEAINKRFQEIITDRCIDNKGIWVEAESFADKGGWAVDQQFTFEMGSPYLIAHGLGKPVDDAVTTVRFPEAGKYHICVRTYNWTSPWSDAEGAGGFKIKVNDKETKVTLGNTGNSWMWQYAGAVRVKETAEIRLTDLTGFDGRCDAIWFTPDQKDVPPTDLKELAEFRQKNDNCEIKEVKYDFVVIGGGVAGMCASVAASRMGSKVALINDRPIWGGCNSSEIRVHLGGHIEMAPYTNLGNMIKEFGPEKGGNAQPAENYEDQKKKDFLEAEKENLDLYPSYRVYKVDKKDGHIHAVYAKHIENGEIVRFVAPIFSDCTGDGTVGYLAGADFAMGREGKADYNEPSAPDQADKMTMGSSVQWYSVENEEPTDFPIFEYGLEFDKNKCLNVKMGEWTWETGMNRDQCFEFERIRDYGMMVVYSNWSYLKNRLEDNQDYANRSLGWVAYIAGKRESRRLLGDHVLTENDLVNKVQYPDASFTTSWSIDLHYPDPKNSKHFPDNEFKSICTHGPIDPYAVPYRCLYSRNIDNLFMAGRNISVTHIGLGTVRVMRTTGMMGEVVGMAAGLCTRHQTLPRDIYKSHLKELKSLMSKGMGAPDLKNNQTYNTGGRWVSVKKPKYQ